MMATMDPNNNLAGFPSADPPPPATPFLTKKLLTMVTSGEKNDANNDSRQIPPSSPADSVAQAMKNDLEELVGYIDNLALDPSTTKTPSTNKQLFAESLPSHTSPSTREVFRDRTNNLLDADEPQKSSQGPKQQSEGFENLSARKEPAGSPPPQEASMYFHDESLSLILSQSEDASVIGGDQNLPEHSNLEGSPRLLAAFQRNGVLPTPARSRAISFRTISKDPTPSKPQQSVSTFEYNPTTPSNTKEGLLGNNENGWKHRKGTPYHHSRDQGTESLETSNHAKDKKGTPYPRGRRAEQDNSARKGNEWWRVRPGESSPTRRSLSFLVDSKDETIATNDVTENTLQWEASVATPLPRGNAPFRGTPHPMGKRTTDGCTIADSFLPKSRTVPETPGTNPVNHSNLVLTSPESAKKLLREAITALQEAREERDSAREWAKSIKESVNHWVEEQRELIRTESALTSNSNALSTEILQEQHQAIEELINNLRNEIKASHSGKETQLEKLLVKQDVQIKELSRQLSEVKTELSRVVKVNTAPTDTIPRQTIPKNPRRRTNSEAPGSTHRTPQTNGPNGIVRTASRSERSNASSRGSHRTRRQTPGGGHLIDYGNGVTKEVHPDGTTVTRFQNGDVETRFARKPSHKASPSSSAVMAYYHCKEEVLKITLRDGSVLYEYATGQVERHCVNGVKIIRFPDGTKTIL